MTNEEAIQFLSQIMDALLASNSWLPSTDNPIKESFGMAINALKAQESNRLATNLQPSKQDADDLISRQDAIDALDVLCQEHRYRIPGKSETYSQYNEAWQDALDRAEGAIGNLPSAQPEQRYTEEELRVFQHGISLSMLSKRSAQHWQYDEDMATKIKFLERLYEKVGADMRGDRNEQSTSNKFAKGFRTKP